MEYRTDDARLTIEVMKKAVEHGAKAVNYAKAEDFHYEGCKLTAVLVSDRISGESFLIRARKIVNATGPWVDLMREKDRSKKGKMLRLTKGIHLVFDGTGSRFIRPFILILRTAAWCSRFPGTAKPMSERQIRITAPTVPIPG